MMSKRAFVATLAGVIAASFFMGNASTIANAVVQQNGSADAVYLFDADGVYQASKTWGWEDETYATSDKNNLDAVFACDSISEAPYVFISPRGSEFNASTWKAYSTSAFTPKTKNVTLATLTPAMLISGGNIASVKSSGGAFSLGVACTHNGGVVVDKVFFRWVNVTASTGTWTAVANDTEVSTGSPSATSTATATATATSSPSATATATSSPLPEKTTSVSVPSWANTAVFYELNVRNFTQQSNFAAATQQLERLKKIGVTAIVLDPVFPISVTGHYGTIGSQFAPTDVKYVNGGLTTQGSLLSFVNAAHEKGIKVVLTWVADRTGLDSLWLDTHPDWYQLEGGKPKFVAGRSDQVLLDYSKTALRSEMIKSMQNWVTTQKIDGFNTFQASAVPVSFWNQAAEALVPNAPEDKLFFGTTTEWGPDLQANTFSATGRTDLLNVANSIGTGKLKASQFASVFNETAERYNTESFPLNFLTDLPTSISDGNEVRRMTAKGALAMTALTFVAPGAPSIFNGQEISFSNNLKVHDYDFITWPTSNSSQSTVEKLSKLRLANPALVAGIFGGDYQQISTNSTGVFAFSRQISSNKVIYVVNLSNKSKSAKLSLGASQKLYDFSTGKKVTLAKSQTINLAGFGFKIYSTNAAK